jgi:hypothetical protein
MLRRPARLAVAVVTAALTVAPFAFMTGSAEAQPRGYGPQDPFEEALMGGNGPAEPMKNMAKIVRTKYGYRYTGGQQDNHLVVSRTDKGLRFQDTATRSWKSLPGLCHRQRVGRGIAAVCAVPASTSRRNPTLLEIHPRLGNDYVDGRTLSGSWDLAVLADAGRDVVHLGHGDDFVNGAFQGDKVYGSAGRDWIRTGDGNDVIRGGADSDYLVGGDGRDSVSGEGGADRVYN